MAKSQTEATGEVFNHNVLWVSAQFLSKEAERPHDPREFHFGMPAMLIARLTVEAYVNFLIDVLDPETFLREKQMFGSCTESKIAWICGKLGLRFNKGVPPYQTIKKLNELRDLVVHAKPEPYAHVFLHDADVDTPGIKPGEIEKRVTKVERRRALKDVEKFCQWLNDAAHAKCDSTQRRRLHPVALGGPTQHRR